MHSAKSVHFLFPSVPSETPPMMLSIAQEVREIPGSRSIALPCKHICA